jgi:hypothetical protein
VKIENHNTNFVETNNKTKNQDKKTLHKGKKTRHHKHAGPADR